METNRPDTYQTFEEIMLPTKPLTEKTMVTMKMFKDSSWASVAGCIFQSGHTTMSHPTCSFTV